MDRVTRDDRARVENALYRTLPSFAHSLVPRAAEAVCSALDPRSDDYDPPARIDGIPRVGKEGRWSADHAREVEILLHVSGRKPYTADPRDWPHSGMHLDEFTERVA